MSKSQTNRQFWHGKAWLVALRCNFAAWLDLFLPALLGSSLAFGCALLLLRKTGAVPRMAWICFAAVLLANALGCLIAARRRFFSKGDALVRLESILHLKNRLTSAAAGVGAWPASSDFVDDGFSWRWQKIAPPLIASVAIVFAAARVPIDWKNSAGAHPTDQPIAWSQVQSWAAALEREKLVDAQTIEKLQEQLEQLRNQPAENWYSHSSLEAGDNLRQETEQALRNLQREFANAADALAIIEKNRDQLTEADNKALSEFLQKSLDHLSAGNLPLNKELLDKLKGIDLKNLKSLTAEQLAALQKRLKEAVAVCENCTGGGRDKDRDALLALIGRQKSGGLGGGGGPAPLGLKEKPTELDTKKTEEISNDDLSHATPGDVLGISKGSHEVEKNAPSGPVNAGGIQSAGAGGETVWKNDLTPQEREVLKRYFK